jgi:hypothetical protein
MEYGTETAILIDLHEANGFSVRSRSKNNPNVNRIKYKRREHTLLYNVF